MNTGLFVGAFLVMLAFVWGLWIVFRKGDMVSQPVKVISYFIGAILAVIIAGFVTVMIFPKWAVTLWTMANTSPDVQKLQQNTEQLFGQPQPAVTVQPTSPTSPAPTPVATMGASAVQGQEYIVQLGDTLSSIGRKFGVTAKQIQQANPQITDPNNIKPGQKLIIPQP